MRKIIVVILALALLLTSMPFAVSETHELSPEEIMEKVSSDGAEKKESIRVVVNGDVYTCAAVLMENEWYITASDARRILGDTIPEGESYISLHEAVKDLNYSYEHDSIMDAAYIWANKAYHSDFERAVDLGLADEKFLSQGEKQITSGELRPMLRALVEKYAPDKLDYFDANVATADVPLTRGESFPMYYYAAVCLGADTRNNNFNRNHDDESEFWNWQENFDTLYPNFGATHMMGGGVWEGCQPASFLWMLWHDCSRTGKQIIPYDAKTGIDVLKPLTVQTAVEAVGYLYDDIFVEEAYVPVDSALATTPCDRFLTEEIFADSKAQGEAMGDDFIDFRGMIAEYERTAADPNSSSGYDLGTYKYSERDVEHVANWGFNSLRLNIHYEYLFDRHVNSVNVEELQRLDLLVAAAVKHNIHLNLNFVSVPGRWWEYNSRTSQSVGEFDLYTNPTRQAEAARMFSVLAERYKGISNANLSFMPMWETTNWALSTGLPYEGSTSMTDLTNTWCVLIDAIREKDPERTIFCEVPNLSNSDIVSVVVTLDIKYDNIKYHHNYGMATFIFANMTDAEGAHVDLNNHGMIRPEYPITIYDVRKHLNGGTALQLDGCLVKGTKIDMFLSKVYGNGVFSIVADGETLYTEKMQACEWETSGNLSGLYPYATSEKKISLTLEKDTKEITIKFDGASDGFQWSGMDVYLPEEYAVERWYFPTDYDVWLGTSENTEPYKVNTSRIMICPNSLVTGENITILPDVSYSTESVNQTANALVVDHWAKQLSNVLDNPSVRLEGTGSTTLSSAIAYYTDILNAFEKHGIDWFSNDLDLLFASNYNELADAEKVIYDRECYDHPLVVYPEILKLWQKYQNNGK